MTHPATPRVRPRAHLPTPPRPAALAAYAAFTRWCLTAGIDPTASTPDDVDVYLAHRAARDRALARRTPKSNR